MQLMTVMISLFMVWLINAFTTRVDCFKRRGCFSKIADNSAADAAILSRAVDTPLSYPGRNIS